jgi:hypothetical protein
VKNLIGLHDEITKEMPIKLSNVPFSPPGLYYWPFSMSLHPYTFMMKAANTGILAGFAHASCPESNAGRVASLEYLPKLLGDTCWAEFKTLASNRH